MAKLEQLLESVADAKLRAELEAEVAALKDRTHFGLVYERHLPETVVVGDLDGLKVGDHVRPREEAGNGRDYRLARLDVDQATLISLKDGEERHVPLNDLLTVRRFGDPADVGLAPLGSVSRSDERPYHAVIDGENFHVLQLLTFVYERQVDCIYIDPPYNTGAKDWTYNNRFVDSNDTYRHSKWLSMMEKRLKLAKRLLKPDGVLVVTIDEHEVHHLGLLLEELFPERNRQMVTIVINPKGVTQGGLSRVEEHAIFVYPEGLLFEGRGDDLLTPLKGKAATNGAGTMPRVRWQGLLHSEEDAFRDFEEALAGGGGGERARGEGARRQDRPNMFYPVLIDEERGAVIGAGEPLLPVDRNGDKDWPEPDREAKIDGHTAVWPVRSDGSWGRWYLGHKTLTAYAKKGYVALGGYDEERKTWALSYPYRAILKQVEEGQIEVTGYDEERNVVQMRYVEAPTRRLKTVWHRTRHDAGAYGADLLGRFRAQLLRWSLGLQRLDRLGLFTRTAAQRGEHHLGGSGGLDDVVDAEREQLLPLAGVEREADDAGAAGTGAGAVGGGEAGEIGREQNRPGVCDQHLLLELVCLGGARARLEHGRPAEEEVLDGALGDRGQGEDDRQPLHCYEPPCALAAGIGAVRPLAPSRSRSIFPSEFASARAAATEGSGRATVTGTLAEERSSPSGGSPTVSTRSPRATARARAPAPLSKVASTVTRSPGLSAPPSARRAGTTSVKAGRAAPLEATAARASGAPCGTGAASSRPSTVSRSRSGTSAASEPASPASSAVRRSVGRSCAPAWRSCAATSTGVRWVVAL